MPWTTVVSGDYITSAWANANVRDQVVTPFATTTARSAITPVQGMISTLTNGGATEGIYQYNTANAWRLPWNMPWGYVTGDVLTTTEAITSTSFISISGFVTPSFTPVARRRYRLTLSLTGNTFANAAAQYVTFQIISTTPSAVVGLSAAQLFGTTDIQSINFTQTYANTATAATTFAVQAKVSGGSISLSGATYGCELIVEDIGPSGTTS
jgi:hypothetical protein